MPATTPIASFVNIAKEPAAASSATKIGVRVVRLVISPGRPVLCIQPRRWTNVGLHSAVEARFANGAKADGGRPWVGAVGSVRYPSAPFSLECRWVWLVQPPTEG